MATYNETCEQCGGGCARLYLSPRGSVCRHCVNEPDRGPDDLKEEYPRIYEKYIE